MDSIPGQGTKIPYVSQPENQNIKQMLYFNKFNKDFKNSPHQKPLRKIFIKVKKKYFVLVSGIQHNDLIDAYIGK